LDRKQWIRNIAVFIIATACAGALLAAMNSRSIKRMEESVQYTADTEADKLRQELEYYIQATGYLESSLVAGGGDPDAASADAEMLIDEYYGIIEVWLSPGNTVTNTWPEDPGVTGLDVSALEGLPKDAETFIGSGDTIILGPKKVDAITVSTDDTEGGSAEKSYMQQLLDRQGEEEGMDVEALDQGHTVSDGVASQLEDRVFIIYNPVYIDGEYWGLINAVVSAYTVFDDSGMLALEDAGYNYMIYQMNDQFDLYSALASTDSMGMPSEALFMLGGWEWSVDVALKPGLASKGFGWGQILSAIGLGFLVTLLYIFLMRHRAEEEIIQNKDREISVKSGELDQEREANKAKTEFVSRISHDIRTPIGAILNLTEFAKHDIDDREKLEKDLDRIDSSGKFLLSLINDVLDISKVNSGKIELTDEAVDYDEYLKSISDLVETMCSEKNQSFVLESDHESGLCFMADKVRLRQITLNLLSNAVKYSPEGATVRYISKTGEAADGNVSLSFSVIDEGIGMSEEFQKIMFDEFSQEYDNPLRDSSIQGTGLGLPIVKKLVELMGGMIKVESEVGKGTDITVDLNFPVAEAEDVEVTRSQAGKEKKKIPARVLFAEDNEINAEIASRIFEEIGATADHAADGNRAVEMFTKSPMGYYDAIFMDIQMPVMNGLEATQKIRELDRVDAPAVPIVAMTADAFKEAMEKAVSAGMTDYITKPLEPEKIREILEKTLSER